MKKEEYPYGPLLTCLVPGSKVILCSNVLLGSHIVGSANNSLQPFKISDGADKQLTYYVQIQDPSVYISSYKTRIFWMKLVQFGKEIF
jgi:hypothetical protein